MIFAGKLDQHIEIQRLETAVDAMGATTETWAAISGTPEWAEIMPLRGLEHIEAGKVTGKTPVKMRIRRYSALTEKERLVHGSDTYRILSIEDYRREGDMVLHCEKVT